eukprot:s114_g11.t1
MERPAPDGSAGPTGDIVPATSSVSQVGGTAASPAGVNPMPMTVDEGILSQPAQAYFQFVQNNLTFINEGNIDLFRQEAEERHKQLMEQMVAQLRSDYESRNMQVEQGCMQRISQQHAEMMQHNEKMQAELSNYMLSRTVAEQEVLNQRKELSEAHAKLKNSGNSIALEAEQRHNQNVSQLQSQYEAKYTELRTSHEADCRRIVDDTVKYAQDGMERFKGEENHAMQEMREEYESNAKKSADLNDQLQQKVEDLFEELNKLKAPVLNLEELDKRDKGPRIEELTTPKASAGVDPKPMPRTKEAETMKLNDMPAPELYRQWRNHVRAEVKSCSDKPDEAWLWLNEVFDSKTPREQLEAKLQDPGKFITLDTKLSAAVTRSAKGGLAKICDFKDEEFEKGIQVRGRRVLLMFEDYFRTSEEAGSGGSQKVSQPMGCHYSRHGSAPG